MPLAQIMDEQTYRVLRREGARGGKSGSYADWTKQDLLQRARELGISGRSSMTKPQLINALRNQ